MITRHPNGGCWEHRMRQPNVPTHMAALSTPVRLVKRLLQKRSTNKTAVTTHMPTSATAPRTYSAQHLRVRRPAQRECFRIHRQQLLKFAVALHLPGDSHKHAAAGVGVFGTHLFVQIGKLVVVAGTAVVLSQSHAQSEMHQPPKLRTGLNREQKTHQNALEKQEALLGRLV